jgi:hypothetical protein
MWFCNFSPHLSWTANPLRRERPSNGGAGSISDSNQDTTSEVTSPRNSLVRKVSVPCFSAKLVWTSAPLSAPDNGAVVALAVGRFCLIGSDELRGVRLSGKPPASLIATRTDCSKE